MLKARPDSDTVIEAAAASAAAAPRTPATIARSAMIYLAQKRLPPTPENYAIAWAEAGGPGDGLPPGEAERGARKLRRTERLTVELTELIRTMCDTIAVLADDESWVRGQVEALRTLLAGDVDHVSVAELRTLLAQSGQMQQRIAEHRRQALAQLKSTMVEFARVIAGLMESTGAYHDRLAEHAGTIEAASSLESLSATIRGLLDDTRDMNAQVVTTHQGLSASQRMALSLEREVSRLELELAAASAELTTDHLTQTLNRRGLEEAFAAAQRKAKLTRGALSLALIDVDDFKALNDALGHQAGDDALKHLSLLLKDRLRPNDGVARYGGEEFVILLPGANLSDAQTTLVRLQRELTRHVFMHDEQRRFITFSGGVTAVRYDDSMATALARADDAMYRAKREGKNCVRTA